MTDTKEITFLNNLDTDIVKELNSEELETISRLLSKYHDYFRDEIRQAFADYHATEGCSCCEDINGHEKADNRLAELLNPEPYNNGSGFAWEKYQSKQP